MIYNQIYAKHSFSFTLAENTLEIVVKNKYLGLWCSNNHKITSVHKVQYLFYIPDTRWMKALSRLRMSSHMLEIERGRHAKPQKLPLEQRICQRCISNSVDDKIHFLITCSYFATQQTILLAESKLLNSEFDSLSNDDKYLYSMSSTHRPLVICLAKYTYSCFQTSRMSRTPAL